MKSKKEIMYYARIAENTYARRYANSQEAPSMYVLVDMKDDFCMLALEADFSYSPSILVFSCKKLNGVVTTTFVRHFMSRVENALSLYNAYEVTEKYEGVELDDLFIKGIPEKCKNYSRDFYKMKILGLDDFVDECCIKGWGDFGAGNALDVISNVMGQKYIDLESQTVSTCLNCNVGLDSAVNGDRIVVFMFSHFELLRSPDDFVASTIYVCYEYVGWEYAEDEYESNESGIE